MKRGILYLSLTIVLVFLASYSHMEHGGIVDTSFDTIGPNNTVRAIALQSDQKIIIGGWFTRVGGIKQNYISRLNQDGTVDRSFDIGEGGGSINSVIIQPDGKILIAGWISKFNNMPAHGIVRLNSDGSMDKEFNLDGVQQYVMTMDVQKDGKIIIAKTSEDDTGLHNLGIARLDKNGNLDPTFITSTGPDSYIKVIKIQEDGKILIGGLFSTFNGHACNGLVRLNTDGSLDTAFNPPYSEGSITCIDVDGSQRIIVSEYKSMSAKISRLLPDGTIDNTFMSQKSYGTIDVVKALPNGNVLAGGNIRFDDASFHLMQLNSNGYYRNSLHDTVVDSNPVRCLAIDNDGNILAGGSFRRYNNMPYDYLVRLYYREEEEK